MPKVTFIIDGEPTTVEFEHGQLPYSHHGKPESFLDVAKNFDVPLEHACEVLPDAAESAQHDVIAPSCILRRAQLALVPRRSLLMASLVRSARRAAAGRPRPPPPARRG